MKFEPGMLVQVKEGCAKSTSFSSFDLDADRLYAVRKDFGNIISLEEGGGRSYTASRFTPANLTPLEKVIYGVKDT